MISLILPYWNRQEAANKSLELLAKNYPDLDLEVVIVDDGDPIPFVMPEVNLKTLIVRMPEKSEPMCPATSWNTGVAMSNGEIVVLSCPEILHEKPVLEQMATELERLGPDGYVLASAWCPESKAWHCHSSVQVPDCPPGTGIAFCGAMHRELFERVGGFEESYRDGAGYEDRDLIRKLVKAEAKFVIRDDLVVVHPKTGASIKWGTEKFCRNEMIYRKRWAC